MEPKPVADSHVEMTELVLPSHTNHLGTAFGGVIMAWIDICAAICAQRHSRRVAVTASIDTVHFLAPIVLGNVVRLKAAINHAWRTSMEIGVRVEAEEPLTGTIEHAATAYLTYVAIDDERNPTPVPPVLCENAEEERRSEEAQTRRAARLRDRDARREE